MGRDRDGIGRDGMGIECNEIGWYGMGWDEVGSAGVGWDGSG